MIAAFESSNQVDVNSDISAPENGEDRAVNEASPDDLEDGEVGEEAATTGVVSDGQMTKDDLKGDQACIPESLRLAVINSSLEHCSLFPTESACPSRKCGWGSAAVSVWNAQCHHQRG